MENLNETEAREMTARIFAEMQRVLNAEGDYPDTSDGEESGEETLGGDNSSGVSKSEGGTEGEKKKKKRKKRPKKKNKPTIGQDLDYIDPEEPGQDDPFDPSKTPADRVEYAIARFRKNRKFNEIRAAIFTAYLEYGGIKTGPKMFQGGGVMSSVYNGDGGDIGEPDFEAMKVGPDAVDEPEEGQVIDFTGVVSGFMSQHWVDTLGVERATAVEIPLVVSSLLNYFLVRKVLPEFEDDIKRAQKVCDVAKVELPLIKEIIAHVPGKFDISCSLLFGGEHYQALDDPNPWPSLEALIEMVGVDKERAQLIVRSILGEDVDLNKVTLVHTEHMELEVEEVTVTGALSAPLELGLLGTALDEIDTETKVSEWADNALANLVSVQGPPPVASESNGSDIIVTPDASPTLNLDQPPLQEPSPSAPGSPKWPTLSLSGIKLLECEHSLLPDEQAPQTCRKSVTLWLETIVARMLHPGMRMKCKVFTLSTGHQYAEQYQLYPSFYQHSDVSNIDE